MTREQIQEWIALQSENPSHIRKLPTPSDRVTVGMVPQEWRDICSDKLIIGLVVMTCYQMHMSNQLRYLPCALYIRELESKGLPTAEELSRYGIPINDFRMIFTLSRGIVWKQRDVVQKEFEDTLRSLCE